MKYLLLLLLSQLSHVTSSTSFTRGLTGVGHSAIFGVPRGGGLFGGKDEKKDGEVATEEKKKYPAMTKEEISDWLEHIPVFAVTDSNGAGVVLKPDNATSVFYFFMSPVQANATLSQLKGANEDMDLKVSAFSLGKIWFSLLNGSPDEEVMLKQPGVEGDEGKMMTKGVEYRLVPDTRDLLGARMLLTMSPEDGEKLKAGDTLNAEAAQAALKKAITESPKFNATFNEIPVFTISQMRMQKKPEEGDSGEPVTLLPMYFSLQNLVGTWQQFMTSAPAEVQQVEPAINLLSLHELIDMMQKESEIDWRTVVLVPPSVAAAGEASAAAEAAKPEDAMAQMGGATLGDI